MNVKSFQTITVAFALSVAKAEDKKLVTIHIYFTEIFLLSQSNLPHYNLSTLAYAEHLNTHTHTHTRTHQGSSS